MSSNVCKYPVKEEAGDVTLIRIPVMKFHNPILCRETVLIGENYVDCRFYLSLGEAYAYECGLGSLKLACQERYGGGDNTARLYERYQGGQRLCLCIVDSDKNSPNDGIGITAERVAQVDDMNCPVATYEIIRAREVENLFPVDLYYKVNGIDEEIMPSLHFLSDLDNSEGAEARFYLDVKDGTELKNLLESNGDVWDFWSIHLKTIQELHNEVRSSCVQLGECRHTPCGCVINKRLASYTQDAVELMSQLTSQKKNEIKSEVVSGEWERLGSLVFDWCCAHRPKFVY